MWTRCACTDGKTYNPTKSKKKKKNTAHQLQSVWPAAYEMNLTSQAGPGCRWLWVGNASSFLSDGDEPPLRPPPSREACHRRGKGTELPLAPERGNGNVQPFTSPALRLTESIRPPPPPVSRPIRPNYFSWGCQGRSLARPDHPCTEREGGGACTWAVLA